MNFVSFGTPDCSHGLCAYQYLNKSFRATAPYPICLILHNMSLPLTLSITCYVMTEIKPN